MLQNFWKDETGQDLVEYALVVGILALGTVGTMKLAGAQILLMWEALKTSLTNATTAIPIN